MRELSDLEKQALKRLRDIVNEYDVAIMDALASRFVATKAIGVLKRSSG